MANARREVAVILSAMASLVFADAAATGGAKSPHDRPFRIVATDQGFDAPEHVPAGIRHIVFENHGAKIHEGMLVKLPAGMDAAGYVAQVRAGNMFPKGALDYSGPGLTSPGHRTELWTRVDPGEYLVICWNHAKSVRVHPFRVTPESHDDRPPPADLELRLVDFRFEWSKPVTRGTHVIRIDTVGPSMHEGDLYLLGQGRSRDDLLAWIKRDFAEPAPAAALGGIVDSHDLARTVWLRHAFEPGRYVLHCGMPMSTEAKSGTHYATHADAGMVLEFEVSP